MKAILPVLLLAFLPFASSCSEATAAEPSQGRPKPAKPDVTYTGKVGQWGMAESGAIYLELKGTNMKGKEGTIWFKAEPSRNAAIGLSNKILDIILHTDGQLTIEGKRRGGADGSNALKAMDVLKIGKFTPGG